LFNSIISTVLSNGLWLITPIMLWNMAYTNKLPKPFNTVEYDQGIPNSILFSENILRMILFSLPVLMSLRLNSIEQKTGILIYLIGVLIYFTSWFILVNYPENGWSTSLIGFIAPAYTPLIWLIGIGLIGSDLSIYNIYKPWIYFFLSTLFTIIHSYHAFLAYMNFHRTC